MACIRAMSFLSDLDWGNWFYGMWVAAGTAFATSASVSFMLYFQNPQEHNPSHLEFWVSAGMIGLMTGGKDFFLYLKQNPAPRIITRIMTSTTATNAAGDKVSSMQVREKSTPAPPVSDTEAK